MDETSIVLLIVAIITTLVMGVLVAVTVSLSITARRINERLDDLDENLKDLVEVLGNLSESSRSELSKLHETLEEQQKVHQSIRATSKLIDIVFRKPVVNTVAATQAASGYKKRKKVRKQKQKEQNV